MVHLADEGWTTFRVDHQVVKLRDRRDEARFEDQPPLESIDGCPGHVMTSVSERDPRRRLIDLWTSRNRVARVRDHETVVKWLRMIEDPATRCRLLANPPSSPSFQTLLQVLDIAK